MKILKLTVFALENPLVRPYYLSGKRLRFDKVDSTFVRIDTDEEVYGWGEAQPWGSSYLPAFAKGVRAGIEELSTTLLGMDPCKIDVVGRAMDVSLPGHPYVKSAIDIACWDILGKVTKKPIVDLLGGRASGPVPSVASISAGTPKELMDEIDCYRAEGYSVFMCKIGADVAMDINRINYVAERMSNNEVLMFDVNRGWNIREAITVMNSVKGNGFWFEQPCNTYEECLHVRKYTHHAISLDEGIKTYSDLLRAQRDHACELINIKLTRVGGISEAKRMRDFCMKTGLAMLAMDTGGTSIADTAVAHFAQSVPCEFMIGAWDGHALMTIDPAPGRGTHAVNGYVEAPAEAGLGVEPDLNILGDPVAVYE